MATCTSRWNSVYECKFAQVFSHKFLEDFEHEWRGKKKEKKSWGRYKGNEPSISYTQNKKIHCFPTLKSSLLLEEY